MVARAKVGAHQKYGEVNQEFHELLLAASGNPWRRRTIEDLRRILRLASQISLNRTGRLERSIAEHADLLAALKQRDDSLARRAMRLHLEGQQAAILEAAEPVQSEVA
jgi:DNA-binding GntR family transcriptional regulator